MTLPYTLKIYIITSSADSAFPVSLEICSPSSYIYYGVIKIRLKNLSGICLHDTDNQLRASNLYGAACVIFSAAITAPNFDRGH